MVPLGVGQRTEDDSSPPPRFLERVASPHQNGRDVRRPSPDYGHFARPWRIDQRLIAAAAPNERQTDRDPTERRHGNCFSRIASLS